MADRKRCFTRIETLLFSMCAECTIITLTVIDVLAVTAELLIQLDVVHVPASHISMTANPKNATGATLKSSIESVMLLPNTTDPGGGSEEIQDLYTAQIVFHNISLVAAVLFLVEITCKLIVKNKAFFQHRWLIFDAIVVGISFAAELAFTAISGLPPALEAATYVVLFRLWRIPYVCNMRLKDYRSNTSNELYEIKTSHQKTEKHNCVLQQQIEHQEKELNMLQKIVKDYNNKSDNNSNDTQTETISNGYITSDAYTEFLDKKASYLIKPDTKEVSCNVFSEESDTNSIAEDNRGRIIRSASLIKGEEVQFKVYNRVGSESSLSQDGAEVTEVVADIEGLTEDQTVMDTSDSSPNTQLVPGSDDKEVIIDGMFVYTNDSFEGDLEEEKDVKGRQLLAEIDGTKTYRSKDGIPMTDL